MNDLEAMNEMAKKNMDIRMSGTILDLSSTKKKSTITMQLDYETAQRIMIGLATNSLDCYVGLYVIDKKQFEKVKSESKTTSTI